MRAIATSAVLVSALLGAPSASSGIFADIPTGAIYEYSAETIYRHGVTTGCLSNPLRYCPNDAVTRLQMAIFMLRGMHGPGYLPPAAVHTFTDVSGGDATWASKAIVDGVLATCGTNQFCPTAALPRQEMARALVRARYGPTAAGSTYVPGLFSDVDPSSVYAPFIQRIYNDAVTFGCGTGLYCPNDAVTRASMALFMVRNFEWRNPEPAGCFGSPCVRTIIAAPTALSGTSINSDFTGPTNQWKVEVRHMGDPGTAARINQVATQITWNVGEWTGLTASSANQRGYQDLGAPSYYNAFQAQGSSFGSHVHSWSFPHNNGVPGGGPHSVLSYLFSDNLAPQIFTQPNSSFVIEAYLKVPLANVSEAPSEAPLYWYPRGEASLQFQFWEVDLCTPPNCAIIDYVAKAFDTRPYAFGESNSFQATAYAPSEGTGFGLGVVAVPMRGGTTVGHTWVDVTAPAGSTGATMANVTSFASERLYRFVVNRAEFSKAIAILNSQGGSFTTDPAKYKLRTVSVLHEIFHCAYVEYPGTPSPACATRAVRMGVSARSPRVMEWY